MSEFTRLRAEHASEQDGKKCKDVAPIVNIVLTFMALVVIMCIFALIVACYSDAQDAIAAMREIIPDAREIFHMVTNICLLYTSDAADE